PVFHFQEYRIIEPVFLIVLQLGNKSTIMIKEIETSFFSSGNYIMCIAQRGSFYVKQDIAVQFFVPAVQNFTKAVVTEQGISRRNKYFKFIRIAAVYGEAIACFFRKLYRKSGKVIAQSCCAVKFIRGIENQ